MSIPNIPDIKPDICLCTEDVVNLLLSSIALEEIALSNIINAESEKLLYIVKNKSCCYCINDLIKLNSSIEKVLSEVSSIQTLLVTKLKHVKEIYNDNINDIECEEVECDIECDEIECEEVDSDIDCQDINCICDECCSNNCNVNNKCNINNECNKYFIPEEEIEINNECYTQKNCNIDTNNVDYYKNYNKLADIINKFVGRNFS